MKANMTQGVVFTTLYFLYNLRMGPISWSGTLHLAGKVCKEKTLHLFGLTRKLQRKWSVANMTQGVVFTTLNFLYNLRMGQISWSVSLHYARKASKGQTL
jgi:hypothetical protein